MSAPLFDQRLRALRRDRAARLGAETFLYDRAFEDCLDRLRDIRSDFRSILVAGCPNPAWPHRFGPASVSVVETSPVMAERAGGMCANLESLPFEPESFDLCISVGELDTANNLPLAAAALHLTLRPGGLLLGAIAGGNSLPRLRKAMLAADAATGRASPHVHPRIDPPSLVQLLTGAGFAMPVIDVDRVDLAYGSLDGLVHDLRAMGATNILNARSRDVVGPASIEAARRAFLDGARRVTEQLEILHFAAWKPA